MNRTALIVTAGAVLAVGADVAVNGVSGVSLLPLVSLPWWMCLGRDSWRYKSCQGGGWWFGR